MTKVVQLLLWYEWLRQLYLIFLSVANHTLKFLRDIEDRPVLDVEEINPKIYDHADEMAEVLVCLQGAFQKHLWALKSKSS